MNPVDDFLNYWREGKGPANDNASKLQEYHARKSDALAALECDAYKLARLTKSKTGFSLSVDDIQAHKLWEELESLKSQIAACEKDIAEFIKLTDGNFGLDQLQSSRLSTSRKLSDLRSAIAHDIKRGGDSGLAADRLVKFEDELESINARFDPARSLTNKYYSLVE